MLRGKGTIFTPSLVSPFQTPPKISLYNLKPHAMMERRKQGNMTFYFSSSRIVILDVIASFHSLSPFNLVRMRRRREKGRERTAVKRKRENKKRIKTAPEGGRG